MSLFDRYLRPFRGKTFPRMRSAEDTLTYGRIKDAILSGLDVQALVDQPIGPSRKTEEWLAAAAVLFAFGFIAVMLGLIVLLIKATSSDNGLIMTLVFLSVLPLSFPAGFFIANMQHDIRAAGSREPTEEEKAFRRKEIARLAREIADAGRRADAAINPVSDHS